jgi:hypothetical protein
MTFDQCSVCKQWIANAYRTPLWCRDGSRFILCAEHYHIWRDLNKGIIIKGDYIDDYVLDAVKEGITVESLPNWLEERCIKNKDW